MTQVINLGLPRTGTQSLHKALQILGYSSRHYAATLDSFADYSAVCELSIDIPIADVVEKYPDAIYLWTCRDYDEWFASVARTHPKAKPRWNPFWKLPCTEWEECLFKRCNEALANCGIEAVRMIHATDPERAWDDLSGRAWDDLCSALNMPAPEEPWPRMDRTK